jgi:hypothetical protein
MKILVLGNTKIDPLNPKDERIDGVGISQVRPFSRYKDQILKQFGASIETKTAETPDEIVSACGNSDADIFFVRPSWSLEPAHIKQAFMKVRQANPSKKIIFIDPFDQTSSKYFEVLPYVDLFLKYQRMKSLNAYQEKFVGGTKYSDFYTTQWGLDAENWDISSPIPEGHLDKIATGWNLGEHKVFQRSLYWSSVLPFGHLYKNIDICCRVRIRKNHVNNYYGKQRFLAVDALKPLADQYKLAANVEFNETNSISRRQYKDEFRRSRIALSPFGWGEQTWRDFEAIFFNALLIKPRMDHIDTYPNIYIPGETYVPISWDFSDLKETCIYYLDNPSEAGRIIKNARQVYQDYFKNNGFLAKLKELLSRL